MTEGNGEREGVGKEREIETEWDVCKAKENEREGCALTEKGL